MRIARWVGHVWLDARFALRMARRNPGVTLLAVATLALGVGSTTAIFSVFKAVLLNQLPYRDPDRVVSLSQFDPTAPRSPRLSLWVANEWRTRTRGFASISLYGDAQRILVENGEAEVLRGVRVDHEFFDTLGVTMLLGRTFRADEDRWPRANVVILSHALWVRRFGADPAIIGRILALSTEPYRVIGVLPPVVYPLRMSNPAEKPEIFMPMGYDPGAAAACRNCLAGFSVARLEPGVELNLAKAELNRVMQQITREYPSEFARNTSVRVEALRDHLVASIQTALWALLGAVAFVLLIACANVANLLLARATARTKEISVRTALGCSRWRLAGQLLTESLLLSLVGGIAGVLLGWWGAAALARLAPKELPRLDEVRMDASVLLFGLGLSILTGLLFGMLPALRASRFDAVRGHARSGLRNILVIAEVALAFVLAVGTGLLTKSLLRLTSVNSGFYPHHIFTLTLTLDGARYDKPEATRGYYRQVLEKVRAVPGVLSAGMASNVPLSRTEPAKFRAEGAPNTDDSEAPSVDVFWASPDYFRVLRIPLQRGRFFTDHDGLDQPPGRTDQRIARKVAIFRGRSDRPTYSTRPAARQ
jgi:putative ABC transport system permease protein